MKKLLISVPYVYPLCPLNFSHAKMFVVADILNRYFKLKQYDVIYPVASHYSGNSAQKISEILNKTNFDSQKPVLDIFKKVYSTPNYALSKFNDSSKLLDYYTKEIYWELKNLKVDCDYKHTYSTSHPNFSVFVKTMIRQYEKLGLLIKNKDGDLALNYDDKNWKKLMTKMLEGIEIQTPNSKKIVKSAIPNIRSDWGLLRKSGFGVKYDKNWVIDPMFDSELFNIFDLYMIFKDSFDKNIDREIIFASLFDSLKSEKKSKYELVNKILSRLPCDIFVSEEHLKNWLIKKMYTESILLHKKYQTKKILILGIGLLDGKRMSASRGHSIMSRNLINNFGGIKARAIMIVSGGNISKQYNYDPQIEKFVKKTIKNLSDFIIYLNLMTSNSKSATSISDKGLKIIKNNIEKNIKNGYIRQSFLELTSILIEKYKNTDTKVASEILLLYNQYLEIFLPGFMENFKNE